MKKIEYVILFSTVALFSCQQMNGQSNQVKTAKVQTDKWKGKLSANAYDIMVNKGTEPPYKNAYWNNIEIPVTLPINSAFQDTNYERISRPAKLYVNLIFGSTLLYHVVLSWIENLRYKWPLPDATLKGSER